MFCSVSRDFKQWTSLEASSPQFQLLLYHELSEEGEASSASEVVIGSFFRSWLSYCTLGVILVRPNTTDKVHQCSKYSLFVDNGSFCILLESQHPRKWFVIISRLMRVIDVTDFSIFSLDWGMLFRLVFGSLGQLVFRLRWV